MGPPGSPLPADSNTTFGNLSSIASYRSRDSAQIDLNEDADEVEVTGPEAFAQPAASDTTFGSLGSWDASTMRGDLQDDAHSNAWNLQTIRPA